MLDRIATSTTYSSLLANLTTAQASETKASNQLSSGENATDLKGYAGQAETLTAMQAVQAQTTGYLNQSQITAAKLSTQDLAFTQLNDSASGGAQAITEAIGEGSGETLMQSLNSEFQTAVSGLNTTYNGEYIFSGGQVNTPATSATNLTDLASAASVSSLFNNDQHVATTQLTSNSSVQTGFLASNLGTNLYTTFQAIAQYNAGPNGPFGNPLTAAQTSFLQSQLSSFQSANTQLTNNQAQNGLVQQQVTNAQTELTDQQTTMTGLINNITQVNTAQAVVNLQQAQQAVEAAAQAFNAVNTSSSYLLSVLQTTPA